MARKTEPRYDGCLLRRDDQPRKTGSFNHLDETGDPPNTSIFTANPNNVEERFIMLSQDLIEKTVSFHGHHCPGLTIGMRAGEWCLKELGSAADEEIVAIVETDMCGVDAIQFLTGCTFGKGNLVFRDYGKTAFSFFRRSDGKNARLLFNRSLTADLQEKQNALVPEDLEGRTEIRHQMIDRMMSARLEEMFVIGTPREEMPQLARIHKSVACSLCGEEVMETRLIRRDQLLICIPCDHAER